jgi:hypothetical protein
MPEFATAFRVELFTGQHLAIDVGLSSTGSRAEQ